MSSLKRNIHQLQHRLTTRHHQPNSLPSSLKRPGGGGGGRERTSFLSLSLCHAVVFIYLKADTVGWLVVCVCLNEYRHTPGELRRRRRRRRKSRSIFPTPGQMMITKLCSSVCSALTVDVDAAAAAASARLTLPSSQSFTKYRTLFTAVERVPHDIHHVA